MTYGNKFGFLDDVYHDAFGRLRISEPTTVFDSKQVFDNQPLLWDEKLESGSGISSAHSTALAATTLTSTLSTAGKFTRQTFMRFNYQPGKSQLVLLTGVMYSGDEPSTGSVRRVGMFDDDNGIFFELTTAGMGVVRRTSTSGSAVDNRVEQASWNIDPMDGTGPSGVTVDWSKAQIFVIDFEWLGVGRVRVGLNIDGKTYAVHQFVHANNIATVYMSTPNLPLRYQLETTASSSAEELVCICASVMSEGGTQDLGVLRYKSTEGTHIDCDTAGTIYAICGIKLKSAYIGATVKLVSVSMVCATADDFEWLLILNPTVANAVSFGDETNSAVQTAVGNAGTPSNSTLTGGTKLAGGFVKSGNNAGSIGVDVNNALLLGADIDDVVDEIYLACRPLTAGADIDGSITWREVV